MNDIINTFRIRVFIILALIAGYACTSYGIYSKEKIHPYLSAVLRTSAPYQMIPVYIKFSNNLLLSDFDDIPYNTPKKERRVSVINRLVSHSELTQGSVRRYLASLSASDAVNTEYLWIANIIKLEAVPSVIFSLASDFSGVLQICYDPVYPDSGVTDGIGFNHSPVNYFLVPEPGVILMNADDCWALGNKGKGVLVANLDNGFHWRHPDLVHGIWQNLGEDANNNGMTVIFGSGTGSAFDNGDLNNIDDDGNGKIDDLIGWDFTAGTYNIASDAHGSGTMGSVIGDGTMGTQTGVSPEAKGICLRTRNLSGGYTEQIAGFQYALLMGADIITSSKSWKWYLVPKPDYSLLRQVTDMTLAAGIIHTNSTGNDGDTVGVPLNLATVGCNPAPWRHPDQLKAGNQSGVIGVGNVNVTNDLIHVWSPHGPTLWGNWPLWGEYNYTIHPNHYDYPYSRVPPVEIPDSMGLLKPDVSAPGQNTISTYVSSGTGYSVYGGTSAATPHTAGCLALMLSQNPEMLPQDLDRVIELTAVEKGLPGKDYRYGAGRIDALAATTSPPLLAEGINGGSNWYLGNTTVPNDTARELVGLKLKNTSSPWIGSLKKLIFNISGTAVVSDIENYRLFWDVNKNSIVDAGDRLLKEVPFEGISGFTQCLFDSLKFKITDTSRNIILTVKTKMSANPSHTINCEMQNRQHIISYYVTLAQIDNFPFGNVTKLGNPPSESLSFGLSQNYPNPFNSVTVISFTLAEKSSVKITVFDVLGREAAVLLDNVRDAGYYRIEFDSDFYGGLGSGVYYYRMQAHSTESNGLVYNSLKKMILIK